VPEDDLRTIREEVATACRILARAGLVEGVLGHVSARTPSGMVLRSRGPEETGLLWTEAEDIVHCDLDGGVAEPTEHRPPGEHPIHGEVYRARRDAGAVVHAHPPAVLACDLAGIPLRPIFGAYNIPAMRLALAGVPVFERSWLINRADLAQPMVARLGEAAAIVLRGHGVVVTGKTVQAATIRALDLEALARVCLHVAQAGGHPPDVSPEDIAELPDLGAAFNDELAWAHHVHADSLARQAEQESLKS
jgi:3,4-dihydroxyphthalate decarboxylase